MLIIVTWVFIMNDIMANNHVDFTFLIPYLNKLTKNGYFYNPAKLLSYKKPFNVMQTSRSVGKTTIFMSICLLNYVLKHKQFVYIRRTDTETLDGARDFFADVDILKREFPEFKIHTAYYEANRFYYERLDDIDEDGNPITTKIEIGRTMPLSFVYKRKSSKPKNANLIIFEEFVALSQKEYLGTQADLKEEYNRLINFYQTLDRGIDHAFKNETAIFCLGNSSTLYNPVFLGLNCLKYIQKDSKFIAPKNSFYVIERVEQVEATKDIEQSFGYIMASEDEKRKMYKNDTGEFEGRYIGKKPNDAKCLMNIVLGGCKYGIYHSNYKLTYYIGKPNEKQAGTAALDVEGHEMTDAELVYAMNDFWFSNNLKRAYQHSRLFFDSLQTQRKILSYLKVS